MSTARAFWRPLNPFHIYLLKLENKQTNTGIVLPLSAARGDCKSTSMYPPLYTGAPTEGNYRRGTWKKQVKTLSMVKIKLATS